MKQLSHKQAEAIFSLSPFELAVTTNQLGQVVRFLEHPTQGDSSPVLIHIQHDGYDFMSVSDFFETYDMTEMEDYMPLLVEGKILFSFEVEGLIDDSLKQNRHV